MNGIVSRGPIWWKFLILKSLIACLLNVASVREDPQQIFQLQRSDLNESSLLILLQSFNLNVIVLLFLQK